MFHIIGNQNLVPEKSNHLSISAEYSHKRVNVPVMGFYNNIQDKITEVFNARKDTALYINVNHAGSGAVILA
jgi:outer membrane receptor for ferrienterochelin and colicins